MSAPDVFAELFEKLPTKLMADALPGFQERGLLGEFREWLESETYDPARPGGRGGYSERLLLACDEAIEFGSDAAEVLRCLITGYQLSVSGAHTDIPLVERVAALRPQPDEDAR
jgi:hypothetical protein